MTGLMVCRDLLLVVGEQHRLTLCAHEDFVLCQLEVVHVDSLAVLASSVQSGLIDHIGQIGSRETWCAACQDREIDIISDGNLARMHAENLFAATNIRTRDHHAAIKTSGTQQRGIEHVRTVGGGYQDHAFVRFKAIHFDEQLVKRLLALVVSTAETSSAMASDRVNFIDEDDARSVLLALLEQVAHAARTNADEHLYEVRT